MASDAGEPGSPGGGSASERKRVLIVEDNPLNMKLFAAMIASQGYQVLQASEGARALVVAHEQHPDLIVMDLQLPGMSGMEVAHSLKSDADTRDIPIIATSAYTRKDEVEKVRAGGVDGFMAKPIAISEFLDMIEAFMAGRREGQNAPAA
jgi:two-component system, cell cycle response regulator DivK